MKNIINKGTGAGGAKTNLLGKKFEDITNNEQRLIEKGFEMININPKKFGYYLFKKYDNDNNKNEVIFFLQSGLKFYIEKYYDIKIFRNPDEAYIIKYNNGKNILKILEKKEQNTEGSVETKLWSAPSLKREYELLLGDKFEISYALCVNDYLQNKFLSSHKKYVILNKILKENNIPILFGDDSSYYENLDEWIYT